MTTMRDRTTVSDPRLGRLRQFDERSRNYPVRTLLPKHRPPRSYTWECALNLDQDGHGGCVWFAIGHELAARPGVVAGVTAEYGPAHHPRINPP